MHGISIIYNLFLKIGSIYCGKFRRIDTSNYVIGNFVLPHNALLYHEFVSQLMQIDKFNIYVYFKVKNTSVHLIYFPSDVTDVIIAQYSKKDSGKVEEFFLRAKKCLIVLKLHQNANKSSNTIVNPPDQERSPHPSSQLQKNSINLEHIVGVSG